MFSASCFCLLVNGWRMHPDHPARRRSATGAAGCSVGGLAVPQELQAEMFRGIEGSSNAVGTAAIDVDSTDAVRVSADVNSATVLVANERLNLEVILSQARKTAQC